MDPATRRSWLEETCRGEDRIREAVEELLEADRSASPVLDASLPELVRGVLPGGDDFPDPGPAGGAPDAGDRVGPYRLVRELGRGGMGVVWLAERADEHFTRQVALKLLSTGLGSREGELRFRRERQVLASLEHTGIARLYDGGVSGVGRPWLAMELVKGRRIDRWADERRLSVSDRLSLFLEVCDAVGHAHRNLVVHRDLKPSNILVTDEGSVKLLDFGIAKVLSEATGPTASPATRPGLRVMTPEYASPEQLRNEPVTTASDVYALGLVLFELLTGRRAFEEATGGSEAEAPLRRPPPARPSIAAIRSHGHEPGTRTGDSAGEIAAARGTTPRGLARRLRGDLDNVVLNALREEPERRYGSVDALRRDLERHLTGHPVEARPASAAYRLRKFAARHRAAVAAALLVLLALAAGLGATLWQAREAARERDVAREVSVFLEDLFSAPDPFTSEAEGADPPTLRDVLDRGTTRVRAELAGQPRVQARLLGVLGSVYRSLGTYEESRSLLEDALALRREELGPEHPELAEPLSELGETLRQAGDYERSEALARQGLAMRRAALDPTDPLLAESLTHLGHVLLDRLKLDDAEAAYREALSIRRAEHADPHPDVARALGNLAAVHQRRGDPVAARPLLEEAVDVLRGSLGNGHPATATVMNSLAVVLLDLREYEAAEPLARRALEARRTALGEDHPQIGTALNTLAQALWYQEDSVKLDEAERLFLASLELRRRVLGEGHPDLGVALNNLATFYASRQRYDEAADAQRRAMAIMEGALGPAHPAAGIFRANLANHRRDVGDPSGALALADSAVVVLEGALPPNHASLANARYGRGLTLQALRRFDLAETDLRAALESFESTDHPRVVDVLTDLAELYEAWGRTAEVEAIRARIEERDRETPSG